MTAVAASLSSVQRRLLHWIELYQAAYSGRPSPCRFSPSCSYYAHEAITLHGSSRGLWLSAKRLARCHPFGKSGYDPVPEPQKDR
jgi:putative membrane protein insertion efficiency factor